jgi:DNA-binding MarR family transcriptional regulator
MTKPEVLAQTLLETLPLMGQHVVRTMRLPGCNTAGAEIHTLIHVRMLHELEGGPKTFQQLLASRGVTAATLSRSIDAMVKHGWIERVPHPEDRRQVLLQSTDAGHRYFHEMVDNARAQLARSLSQLDDGERETILAALHLLRRALIQTS